MMYYWGDGEVYQLVRAQKWDGERWEGVLHACRQMHAPGEPPEDWFKDLVRSAEECDAAAIIVHVPVHPGTWEQLDEELGIPVAHYAPQVGSGLGVQDPEEPDGVWTPWPLQFDDVEVVERSHLWACIYDAAGRMMVRMSRGTEPYTPPSPNESIASAVAILAESQESEQRLLAWMLREFGGVA